MTPDDLREEVLLEVAMMETVVMEAVALRRELGDREPSYRDKTAASAFLSQFYGGIENIMKRLCRYHGVALPKGDTWHVDIFRMFREPSVESLPVLFDTSTEAVFSGYRKFRHVVHHGYGFQLDWARMAEGIDRIETSFSAFRARLDKHLSCLAPK